MRLAEVYGDSAHVFALGLECASDAQVWKFARENSYAIVTQDTDFSEFVAIRGFPPKVVWIRRGNCTTSEIEKLLRDHREDISKLISDPDVGLLVLL